MPSTPTPGPLPPADGLGAAAFLTCPGEAQPLLHLLSLNVEWSTTTQGSVKAAVIYVKPAHVAGPEQALSVGQCSISSLD